MPYIRQGDRRRADNNTKRTFSIAYDCPFNDGQLIWQDVQAVTHSEAWKLAENSAEERGCTVQHVKVEVRRGNEVHWKTVPKPEDY